eukprot:scaffold3899_cov106-Isochrysis_galbana.AAC.4
MSSAPLPPAAAPRPLFVEIGSLQGQPRLSPPSPSPPLLGGSRQEESLQGRWVRGGSLSGGPLQGGWMQAAACAGAAQPRLSRPSPPFPPPDQTRRRTSAAPSEWSSPHLPLAWRPGRATGATAGSAHFK